MQRKRFKSNVYVTLTRSQLALFLSSALILSAALFFIGFMVGRGYFSEKSDAERAELATPSLETRPQEKTAAAPMAQQPKTSKEAPSAPGGLGEIQFTFFESLPEKRAAEGVAQIGQGGGATTEVGQKARAIEGGAAKKELKEAKVQTPSPGSFTIQVAAFKEKAMADSLSDKLRQKGYRVRVELSGQEEKGAWHKVEVGDFKTEREAMIILRKIKGEEGLKGFIIKK